MKSVIIAASRGPASLPSPSLNILRHGAAMCFAVVSHGGLFWLASQAVPSPKPEQLAVTEVSLLAAALPEPPIAEEPANVEPEVPQAEPAPEKPAVSRPRPQAAQGSASPKQFAKAAALRTAQDNAPTQHEPVRFVSDPNGTSFGFGTVAQGGTLQEARSVGPVAAAAPRTSSKTSGAGKASAPYQGALASAPRPRSADPCRGYFPRAAHAERGEARVHVTVSSEGQAVAVQILSEQPTSQGFGAAARTCLSATRFEPARDLAGRAVTVIAPITIKFSR